MMQPAEGDGQHLGTLWMIETGEGRAVSPRTEISVLFSRVNSEVAEELAQAMELSGPEEVLQRFLAGRHCYIARVGGCLASYGWVTFDEERIGELGLNLCLGVGEAYIWGCATLPLYRGLRLYPALLGYMLAELRAAGVSRVWIGADSDNLASQKGFTLVGFQPIADLMLTAIDPRSHMWIRGCSNAPAWGVEAVRAMLTGAPLG